MKKHVVPCLGVENGLFGASVRAQCFRRSPGTQFSVRWCKFKMEIPCTKASRHELNFFVFSFYRIYRAREVKRESLMSVVVHGMEMCEGLSGDLLLHIVHSYAYRYSVKAP